MANITDVAALAGVSRQTVSRVLNDEQTVTASTRARVKDAIRELRYRPSAAARALVTRKTRTIGLVTTGAPLYGPSSTMLAFNEAARRAGYRVAIASMSAVDPGDITDAIEGLLGQNVEALVLIAAEYAALEAISGLDIPVPLVTAESSGRAGLHSVSIDQFEGARMMTEHLIGLGHRGILHLAGPTGSVDASERVLGWRAALETHGIAASDPLIGDWMPGSGYAAGEALVDGGRLGAEITAVFSSNDQMALGLLSAFHDRGIGVPAEISVVGFDDIPEAAYLSPPLTTVRQDFVNLGSRMMDAVLAVLGSGAVDDPLHVTPELVLRSSARVVTEP